MNTEKTIRIFIGSSIIDLELERMKLMSFIQGLNNKYHERGVFIEGYICEETPNDMREGGSQKLHNDYISGSADATIFMFFHKAGEFTMKELELARQAFLEKGKPNVYVFFKAVENAPDVNDEIQKAVSLVFDDYGHYYKMFDDVDTVKLELLQFLMELLPGKGELVIKDGAVYMNGELIKDISAANIFAYQNNPNLKALKEQIASLRKLELAAAENGDGSAVYRFSASRCELEKQYHELEADILDALIFFFEQNKKGGKADPVLAEALRQLELGNIAMAKTLIPREELDRMAESIAKRRALMEAQLRDEEETLLARTRARIRILQLDLENQNRFAEIEHACEIAYETAKNAKDYDFIFGYVIFLHEQKNYPRAIAIAEKLKHIYDNPDNRGEVADYHRVLLLNMLGTLYRENNALSKVEAIYTASLKLCKKIFIDSNSVLNGITLAMILNNLGAFYSANYRLQEAEASHLEALDVYRSIYKTASYEVYWRGVADTYCALGILYGKCDRTLEAEKMYFEGIRIRRNLVEKTNNGENRADLAAVLNNLATLYIKAGRINVAESLLLEAIENYSYCAENISHNSYDSSVAIACQNLGSVYLKCSKPDEAEKHFLSSLEVFRYLASEVSHEAFDPHIADICINLGLLYAYVKKDNMHTAENYFSDALEIRRGLAKTVSRTVYEPLVAETLFNLGLFYLKIDRDSRALEHFSEALSIAKRYKDVSPSCRQIWERLSN